MDEFEKTDFDFDFLLPLKVGDIVPTGLSFEVFHNNEFSTMSFQELRGKWCVLFFYPADFTFVCPTELSEMADLYQDFIKAGAEVVAVSTDTVYCHKAWHDGSETIKKISFPMAGDPSHTLSDIFGVLIDEKGVTQRGTFIIDPDGVIKSMEINEDAIGRSGHEALRKLKAAAFVREHPTNVCPASWNDGDETLEPGVGLVGKI